MRGRLAAISLVALSAVVARAADAPPVLGDRFSGPYDVSFKPFSGSKPLDREGINEIARFGREDKRWLLVFDRTDLPDPQPMKDFQSDAGVLTAGYLSSAVNKLRAADANSDVLRNEVIDLGDLRIGVLAAVTHDKAGKPVLLQQAMMEITAKLHYGLTMTCPMDTENLDKSAAAGEAGGVFKAILDSIVRVDLSAMKQDQDDRLYRTRGLFAQWSRQKLLGVLVPERYLRFKRDGKDVGYAYVVEQPADGLPKLGRVDKVATVDASTAAGIRVGQRTHTVADGDREVNVEGWSYVTFDRRHEVWSNVSLVNDPHALNDKDKLTWFSELGSSDMQREREFKHNLNHDDFKDFDERQKDERQKADPAQQPFVEVDKYRLTVRNAGRNTVGEPINRDLPVFYLPEALATLLPRLVPLDNVTGYLFASYNTDNRQIMLRYVDVQAECDVKLDGKSVRAVPVVERFGFAGPATTHYLTRRGAYLGSINAEAKLEVYPTDRDTLVAAWKDANLSQPAAVKLPEK